MFKISFKWLWRGKPVLETPSRLPHLEGTCVFFFLRPVNLVIIFTPTWGRFPFGLIFFKGVWNHQLDLVQLVSIFDGNGFFFNDMEETTPWRIPPSWHDGLWRWTSRGSSDRVGSSAMYQSHLGKTMWGWNAGRRGRRVARRYASDRARRNRLGWRHGHQKPFSPDNFCGNRQSEYNPERVVLIFCHYILWLKC